MSDKIQLSASIIAADFMALGDTIQAACDAGVDAIHVDVMDNHFVPNLSIGPMVCESLNKRQFGLPIDVHLMVTDPDSYIDAFAKAGADCVTFHPQTSADVTTTLRLIKEHNMQAGIAFNPDDSVNIESDWLPMLDSVLMMSVYPGFCGQAFIPTVVDRLADLKAWLVSHNAEHVRLAVDGGINVDTLPQAYAGGARFFVVGSALFGANDLAERVRALRESI